MSSLVTPTIQWPAPTGVTALYFGGPNGTTRNYYIQAVYPGGRSQLSATSNQVTALLDANDIVEVKWNPMPGASSYNVFRVDGSSTAPTVGTNFLANTTAPNIKDKGLITLTSSYITSDAVFTAHMYYDFAVDGGAATTITPAQSDVIPIGALVTGAVVYVKTAVTSSGSATVAVGTSAGSSTTSILGATAKASLTLAAVIVGVPNTVPFIMTAAGSLDVTIGTAALLTGVVEAVVTYVMSV